MIEAIRNFPESPKPLMRKLSYMESFHPGKAYVFLQLKVDNKGDYETEYRPAKQAMLEIACAAAKLRFPQLHTIIGIAIEAPKFSGGRNAEDFILMDCSNWTDETRMRYEEANKKMKFFSSTKQIVGTTRTYEFPLDDPEAPQA
jgi:hypothetical protein